MEITLLVNTVAFTLLFVYLLGERLRLEGVRARHEEVLQEALSNG
jgi:hypothetical protein